MQKKSGTKREQAYTSVSVRVWTGQRELLKQAARSKHRTLSDYLRWRMVPQAALDAGVPMPEFPEFVHGRVSDLTIAARRIGVPSVKLRRHVLSVGVAQILAEMDSTDESDERNERNEIPRAQSEIVPAPNGLKVEVVRRKATH